MFRTETNGEGESRGNRITQDHLEEPRIIWKNPGSPGRTQDHLEEPRFTWKNPGSSGRIQVHLEEPRIIWKNPGSPGRMGIKPVCMSVHLCITVPTCCCYTARFCSYCDTGYEARLSAEQPSKKEFLFEVICAGSQSYLVSKHDSYALFTVAAF